MRGYIRTWQMEPLAAATLAALAPEDVELRFHDDRLGRVPTDEPTDLVAMSVETYTARRAYQLASDYRRRGVPVVMGGFHPSLCPEEVARYADSVVVGEAEGVFPQVIDDYRHGRAERIYRSPRRAIGRVRPDRRIFAGKDYLPVTLVESVRGCRFACRFCAITSVYQATARRRPIDLVVEELRTVARRDRLVFFVDDNIISDLPGAKELFRAIAPLGLRWVSQASINVAHDEEALALMRRAGCQGVLVGFESLDAAALRAVGKGFNLARGGAPAAMRNFHRHGIRVYGTFIFGYDHDRPKHFGEAVDFARDTGMFIAAFNHLTPFPGTPLYRELEDAGRLLYPAWWLEPGYRYNDLPFRPLRMDAAEVRERCVAARRSFYSWPGIARRLRHRVHWRDARMFWGYLLINAMHRKDVDGRNGLPFGDADWRGELLEVS